jgi:hypothetical protein
MSDVPFGKFFDTKIDHELIEAMELIWSNSDLGTELFLFKNIADGQYYAVLDDDYFNDITKALEEQLGNHGWNVEEIQPKNPDLYAMPYQLARVSFDSTPDLLVGK